MRLQSAEIALHARLELLRQAERRVQVIADRVEDLRWRVEHKAEQGWDTHFIRRELEKWKGVLAHHVELRDRLHDSVGRPSSKVVHQK